MGRELRRRRRAGRLEHPARRPRDAAHLHLRPCHPRDQRRCARGPRQRACRALAAARAPRLGRAGGRELPAARRARGRARGGGRRDPRRLVRADAVRHAGAGRLPAPGRPRHLRAVRGRPAGGPPAAHRPADRRRLRRRRPARRLHGRADPRRARRPLRERGARPARPDLARPHAEARGLGADGQGRRAGPRRAEAGDAPRQRRRLADRGPAVLEARRVRLRGHRLRAGRGRHQRRHRPVLARPQPQLPPLAARRPRRRRATRLGPAAQAAARPARGLDDLRAARARLLDHRRDGAGPRPRHLPRLHARPQRRHAPPARPGGRRDELPAPAAHERHRDDRGGPLPAAASRRATWSRSRPTPSSSRRASTRSATPTASTGATTRSTTRRPRARTRPGPTGRRARPSSARWSWASTAPGCGW